MFFLTFCRQLRLTLFPYTTLFRSGLGVQGRAMNQQRSLARMPGGLGVYSRAGYLQPHLDAECRFGLDRKSTRLNSSHTVISYAVFCLKKKNGGRKKTRPQMPVSNT